MDRIKKWKIAMDARVAAGLPAQPPEEEFDPKLFDHLYKYDGVIAPRPVVHRTQFYPDLEG
jgi:hypothetical protein